MKGETSWFFDILWYSLWYLILFYWKSPPLVLSTLAPAFQKVNSTIKFFHNLHDMWNATRPEHANATPPSNDILGSFQLQNPCIQPTSLASDYLSRSNNDEKKIIILLNSTKIFDEHKNISARVWHRTGRRGRRWWRPTWWTATWRRPPSCELPRSYFSDVLTQVWKMGRVHKLFLALCLQMTNKERIRRKFPHILLPLQHCNILELQCKMKIHLQNKMKTNISSELWIY